MEALLEADISSSDGEDYCPSEDEKEMHNNAAESLDGKHFENDKIAKIGRVKAKTFNSKYQNEKLKETIAKQKAKRIFQEMQQEYAESAVHTLAVRPDDLLLQFHKKYPKENKKKNATKDDLLEFLNIATSRIEKHPAERFNVKETKDKCRVEVNDIAGIAERAIDGIKNSGSVTIEKTIRFAGKVLTIQEKMDRNSRKYQSHMKNENQKLGGKVELIDKIVNSLDQPTSINSMQKSEADWIKYKEETGVEADLQKNRQDGYLEKQSFLAALELRQYNLDLQKKRKPTQFNKEQDI